MRPSDTLKRPRAKRARSLGVLRSALFYLGVALAAFLLWPSSLGGCTTLIVVSGESMEPTYHGGDIVVARCGTPRVGDVAVYQPSGYGGAKIIHRVIGGDESGWLLQGDNNDFVDPFEPTQDEVLGTARLHIPKIGGLANVITNPYVWGSFIVLALAILMWPRNDFDSPDGDDGQDGAADDGRRADSSDADGPVPSGERLSVVDERYVQPTFGPLGARP